MRVVIVQPVIPHYRVPLFAALASEPGWDVRVMASPAFPKCPPAIGGLPAWADGGHRCVNFAGVLYWQRGIDLPVGNGRGDVLVVAGNPRILSNLPILWSAKRRRMGVVWWGHLWSPTSVGWRARIRSWQTRWADVVLLYTDEELRTVGDRRADRPLFMAAGNALSTAEMDEQMARWDGAALAQFRSAEGLGDKLLLFCGRLRRQPSTELDVAIRCLAQLLEVDRGYALAIIGGGDDEARLKRLANSLGVGSRVRWLGALYDESQLAPWFLTARCLVYPGAIGLTLLHSFAYGLPVVTHSTRALHNPEIAALRDGENGLLFAKGEVRDLYSKLLFICEQPEIRRQLAAAAFRTARDDYSMTAMVFRCREAIRAASRLAMDRR